MAELRNWIRDVGFPAAIAAYVLIQLHTDITALTERATRQLELLNLIAHSCRIEQRLSCMIDDTPATAATLSPTLSHWRSLSLRNAPTRTEH